MVREPVQVTLSDEIDITFIRSKVSSGAYASEVDVVRQALSVLQDEDAELERWIVETGAARYDEFEANPSSGVKADQLVANLADRRSMRRSEPAA